MQSQEIEHYLAELGAELKSQGIKKPVRMLLANAPRTTDDIDMFWVEEGEDFQKARLAMRDGVQTIASKYALPPRWFNHLTQMLIYEKLSCERQIMETIRAVACVCPSQGVHVSSENHGGT